jgi:hypothetical protein
MIDGLKGIWKDSAVNNRDISYTLPEWTEENHKNLNQAGSILSETRTESRSGRGLFEMPTHFPAGTQEDPGERQLN